MASLWLGLLALGGTLKRKELTIFSGLVGLVLGISLFNDSKLIAFLVVLLNVVIVVKEAGSK